MKRVLALLLAFALVFGLAACSSGPKPEDTVKKFFEAMKAFDVETMQACVDGEYDATEMLSEEEKDMTGLMDYLKENAKTLTYKIGSSEVKEDKAKVGVSVEYTDASEVIGDAFGTYIMALFDLMFSEDATEEDLEKAFTEGLANAIETKETTRATEDFSLDLTLKDGEWKLTDVPEELANVMMGNLMHAMDGLGDLFSSDDIDWGGGESVEYPISDVVLIDDEDVTMTIQSGGADEWGNINFSVLCENKTDKQRTFCLDDLVVNGWSMGGSLYEDVAPGKSSVGTLDIWASDMENLGIENPDRVTAKVRVYNEDEWWDDIYLIDDEVTFYPTELTDAQIVVPERPTVSGETVLADDANFTMVLLDSQTDEMWGGLSIRAYIRNNTDRSLYIDWEDVSVNGYMIDPYCGVTLPAGQQRMHEISFAVNDLEECGIETVETIEFTLQVSDDTTGEYLFDQTMTYEP